MANEVGPAVPDVAGGGLMLKMTAAFMPAGAGPWMCPAVAGVVRPEKRKKTLMVVSKFSSVTVPLPVPAEALGGTSLAPENAWLWKYCALLICPRTSPPGNVVLWTLK